MDEQGGGVTLPRSLVHARRAAGAAKRWLRPTPEVAAWQHACRAADTTPRFTPGRIRLMEYDIQYTDLLTLCPQWEDLFVKQVLRFRACHPAPRILDCGANVGLAALYCKRLYPQARVTAFEADPSLHTCLVENLRANGAGDVEAVRAAVWTREGTVDFLCEGADSGMIAQLAGALAGVSRPVPAVRLRTLLEAERIDLLKLDVEGAETALLADCADQLRHVDAMVVEVHELDPAARTAPAVLELLHRAGFTYSVEALSPLPWRGAAAPHPGPFSGAALCWTLLVRAWREPPKEAR